MHRFIFHGQLFPSLFVYIIVIGRIAKLSSGLLLTATVLIGLQHVNTSPPVQRFLEYYEAVEKVEAPINFWERVVCSFMLTRAEAANAITPAD